MATELQREEARTFLRGLRVGDVDVDGGIAWLHLEAPQAHAEVCVVKVRIVEIEWCDEEGR
jgi:hypothetical protein